MKPSPEIEAIVRRIVKSRVSGDSKVLTSLWSEADNTRLIGNDESDWYQGADISRVLEATHTQWPIQEIEILRLEAFEAGDVGWAALEERRTNPDGSGGVFRRTLIFALETGTWKVVQSHFSTPVPNVEATGVDLTATLAELLLSIDSDSQIAAAVAGTTTLLFTDLVDSTPMALALGEQAWLDAIASHLDALKHVVESEGGSVVKTLGDGGMYAFDSGSSALRAAKGIQEAVAQSSGPEMRVRIGVHTGDVYQADDDYFGSTVAKAARVSAAAGGGEVLVSSTTVGLVSPTEFEFGEPVSVELKGLDGVHQLQPLNWS